ncbi:MAG: flippase-like domain-containing protein [Alphaproteobacteria bacterium]|nr:flippase-like domain-containing protein [Alphaproteobacteria bacterium]MCB9697734.1 flippase-like domain-containing protein [Alphaproteobacteria bacterium]
MSERLRLVVVLAVTAVCLVLAARGVDLRGVGRALAGLAPSAVLLAAVGIGCAFTLRVLRFGLLLGDHRPAMREVGVVCGIGFLAIQVVPLRLGELVRPYLLAQRGVGWGRSLGALAVERLLDLLVLIGMLALVGLVDLPRRLEVGGVDVLPEAQVAASSAAAVLAALLVVLVIVGPRLGELPGPLAKVGALAASGAAAVRELGVGRALLGLVLSAAVWGCNVSTVVALLSGLEGLPARPEVGLVVCTATISGVLAVPTPGMVGSFELFASRALALWPVSLDDATAFALAWHGLVLAFHGAVGAALLVTQGVSLGGLVRASRAGRT